MQSEIIVPEKLVLWFNAILIETKNKTKVV